MTDKTPAMPELPEPDRTMWQHGTQIDHYTADQMRAYALAALSSQPSPELAGVSDEEIWGLWDSQERTGLVGGPCPVKFARAILALRPAQQAPEWDGGKPANLQAAARDADEWLALIQRLNDAGRWLFSQPDSRPKLDGCRAALSKILCAAHPQAVPMTGKQARLLSREELAGCCGGCASNSAIETWMRRAIEKFCEVNGITAPAGGEGQA